MIGGCIGRAGREVEAKLVGRVLRGAGVSSDSELPAPVTGCQGMAAVDLVRPGLNCHPAVEAGG